MKKIEILDSREVEEARAVLLKRNDAEARRLLRFLDMPDLSRDETSPLYEMVRRILRVERFKDFYEIKVPEIVGAYESFNLFNFPEDHPARSTSDTYYINKETILRPHTTIMWYYWLKQPEILEKIAARESMGVLSYGKVYRKDEIDRNHMNIFHQMDGLYIAPKEKEKIIFKDLTDVLTEIAQTIFGEHVEYRFNEDRFPYTDPSIEMEIKVGDRWIEVLGSGIVRDVVLRNLGVDPEIYNGWAFGFGLERLAIISMGLPDIRLLWATDTRIKKQLRLGSTYVQVSKYPPVIRDISFIVPKDFVPNNYFDLIRDMGGDLVEEVLLIDKYEDSEKFGSNRVSYTYRITYRSNERTLVSEEIDKIQDKIYKQTAVQFDAELR